MPEKMIAIRIDDMHCARCVDKISETLATVRGVINVSTSLEKKKVIIKFDDKKVNEENLKKVISDNGFSVG